MNKLPSEIHLIVSRVMSAENWELDKIMKSLDQEVEAREHSDYLEGQYPLANH